MSGENIKEACGVFGIYNHPEAARITYLGLFALQHRGEEAAGICSSDGENLHLYKNKGLVGEILIQLGYIEEIDVVVALIMQCGIPYIAVNKYNLDKEVLKLIPEKIAREFISIYNQP